MRPALLATTLLVPALAYGQQCTAPAPAAAAGYNQMTYGNPQLGQNIFATCDGAATQSGGGSISISGGACNHFNNQINTGDIQFGGGAYIQANLSFQNPPSGWSPGSSGWPAFWGTATSDGPHVEADFFEFMTQGNGQKFDFGMQDWHDSGSVTWSGDGGYGHPSAVDLPANFDPSQPHDYGFLWIPASGTNQGSAQMFVDEKPVGPVYNWDQGGGPWSSMDSNRLQILLGTGPDNPMKVNGLQVWQANANNNAGASTTTASAPGGSCAVTSKANTPPICLTAWPKAPSWCPNVSKTSGGGAPPSLSAPSGQSVSFSPNVGLVPASRSSTPAIPSTGKVANPSTGGGGGSCKGQLFSENFQNGLGKWQLGNNGAPNPAGTNSSQADPDAVISTDSNGLNMAVAPGGPSGVLGSWLASSQSFHHGYFEAKMDIPAQAGLTGAFWLTGVDSWPPEIDVTETDGETNSSSTHTMGSSNTNPLYSPVQPGVHTYGADWTADSVDFYVDGQLTHSTPAPQPDGPMQLMLDYMAGGPQSYVGAPDPKALPSSTKVIYVRAFDSMQSMQACKAGGSL